MAVSHGSIPRGLNATKSQLFQGRFGRMFRNIPSARFGRNDDDNAKNLRALAQAIAADPDPPKNGRDEEESGIPALYTYFGQFIDHDITFDPTSSLNVTLDPDGLTDFRNPALNLDNIYGRGPDDQPYMYVFDTKSGLHKFATGAKLTGNGLDATDLPRFNDRALIGDPRNDENMLVSQLQGLFHRIHNRMVDDNPHLEFIDIQQLVRFHYQYAVVNDFLSKIITKSVLESLKSEGHFSKSKLKFYHPHSDPFMPVEFSVAAYRLGHSMVRPGYRLNDDKASLLAIFPPPDNPDGGLTGFRSVKSNLAIDWARFIDIEKRSDAADNRLQFAYRIDTSLVGPLTTLPKTVAGGAPFSLGERNLIRGWRLGLPSGQAVARFMGEQVVHDKDILIGKALDDPKSEPATPILDAVRAKGGDPNVFAGNCPLWTYILAEAAATRTDMPNPTTEGGATKTPQLGKVGGRIVAEVFLGLLFGDGSSYLALAPKWHPITGPDFGLKQLVNYALGRGPALHFQ